MQINRLFEMVYLLLERKTITAAELAEKFEVSTRTIYRDVEILSNAQIPIYASKGKGGGISLLEDYVFNKSLLSEEEQNQILFALQSINKIDNQEEKEILEKMSHIFQKNVQNWIQIDFSNWGNNQAQDDKFDTIKKAILNKQVIEFTYYNSYGKANQRKVEPLQIWFKQKAWYLRAYCKLKQDFRIFKIARMKNVKCLEEYFEKELPTKIEKKQQEFETVSLELEIDQEAAYRVYDEFEPECIVKKENGDFVVTVEYPENDWIYGYLLSFGESIRILSPARVKQKIKEKLDKMIKNYI